MVEVVAAVYRFPTKTLVLVGTLCLATAGCSDALPIDGGTGGAGGAGGTAGVAGTGGAGGVGGTGGTGGEPLEPGLYVMECNIETLPVPYPINFALTATLQPALTARGSSTLTTAAVVRPWSELIPALPSDVMAATAELVVTVEGAQPTDIVHALTAPTREYVPLEMETRMTLVTHDGAAPELTVEITRFSMTVTGIPESLVPGGSVTVPSEGFECGDIVLREGSSVIAFPVYP